MNERFLKSMPIGFAITCLFRLYPYLYNSVYCITQGIYLNVLLIKIDGTELKLNIDLSEELNKYGKDDLIDDIRNSILEKIDNKISEYAINKLSIGFNCNGQRLFECYLDSRKSMYYTPNEKSEIERIVDLENRIRKLENLLKDK